MRNVLSGHGGESGGSAGVIGKKKLKKRLRTVAADLLIIANDLALRHREDCVPAEEAREVARRLRDVAASLAEVAYDIEEEV